MAKISVEKDINGIKGLCLISPKVFKDDRGYFVETYNIADLQENDINYNFVQDNQSLSTKGVLRGLHYQINYPQAKLVRIIKGSVFDVALDLRKGSTTFGQYYGIELNEENQKQLLIPRGFAHGFLVLSDEAIFSYKCDDFYHPNDEGGIIWNDENIGIRWPGITKDENGKYFFDNKEIILSEKDKILPSYNDYLVNNFSSNQQIPENNIKQ